MNWRMKGIYCHDCGKDGKPGLVLNPYYTSTEGVVWRCESCANAKRAKNQKKVLREPIK